MAVIHVAKWMARKMPDKMAGMRMVRSILESSSRRRVSARGIKMMVAKVRRRAAMTREGTSLFWARRMRMELMLAKKMPHVRTRAGEIGGFLDAVFTVGTVFVVCTC